MIYKRIAIIPARGGSKSIKKKNIVPINGIPLVGYTIKEALKSKLITHLCLSTDNEEIASIAKKYKCPHLVMRDYSLANDLAKTFPVVLDALEKMEKSQNIIYDLVILLQPTSPFQYTSDIDNSIKKIINEKQATSLQVVSENNQTPLKALQIYNKKFIKPYFLKGSNNVLNRQKLKKSYYRSNIIISKTENILKNKSQIGKKSLFYIIPSLRSIDINDKYDLEIAKLINQKFKLLKND